MLLKNSTRLLPRLRCLFTKKGMDGLKVQTPMVSGARSFFDRRSDPFAQMENLVRDMERKFWGEVNHTFPGVFSSIPRAARPGESTVSPLRATTGISGPADVSTQDRFKLAFNFPRAKPEDIKVTLKDRLLTVEAKVEEEGEGSKMQQSLNYQFTLPETVNTEALESLFNAEGVLTIEAPKTPEEAPKTINITRE